MTRVDMWQYHLQQMVIAEDPIAYLSEHIWQASLSLIFNLVAAGER
jgi:hypothetical protein